MKVSLRTTVASIPFENCIYNASGPRTGTASALNKIATSASGAVLTKSATLISQNGNPPPRNWHDTSTKVGQNQDSGSRASLNSDGLPNSGIQYYIKDSTISGAMGDTGKPYMVSISGKSLEDNLTMLTDIFQLTKQSRSKHIAAVEINLACPNVIGKPIIAYDFAQMDSVLAAISKLYEKHDEILPLGVKLPPFFDLPHFESAASILNKYEHCIKYVASINTIGNALAIDSHSEMPVIASKGGFSGLSGPAIKYTALANVRKMRQLLNPKIDIVGVGGVQTGQDAFDMILCGANAVQVGTCHWIEGPKCFQRISDELRIIMTKKGYSSIQDFQGKLKDWSKEGAYASIASKKTEAQSKTNKKQTTSTLFSAISTVLLAIIASLLLHQKYEQSRNIDKGSGAVGDDGIYFNSSAILLVTVAFLLAKEKF